MVGRRDSQRVYRAVLGPQGIVQPDPGNLARNAAAGNGGLGVLGMPGSSGRDPGVALDLGTVQRPMGDAAALDLGMAQRPLRDADGRIVLAAGLIGYARLANWLRAAVAAAEPVMALAWVCAALICGVGLRDVADRLARVPVPIDREEAEQVWSWIRQVGHDDAVMVDYEVSAPLSSRRQLYGCELDANLPKGFPKLDPEFRWLFIRNDYPFL